MTLPFPALSCKRLTGDERFTVGDRRVLDFWRWAASNLADNTTRGLLAEYIVAAALDVDGGVRSEWDAFDISAASGLTIEVKSAAYLQAWGHEALSQIRFSIRPTRKWDKVTNHMDIEVRRQANLYVLCLLKHQDKATLNPLDLDQWEFYIVPTAVLNERCPIQKTISLKTLREFGIEPVAFGGLSSTIRALTAVVAPGASSVAH